MLPAALLNIFAGLRVGLGIGWMALVAGELVAAPNGLG
jgi:NitT/TauT family transport system permease protein